MLLEGVFFEVLRYFRRLNPLFRFLSFGYVLPLIFQCFFANLGPQAFAFNRLGTGTRQKNSKKIGATPYLKKKKSEKVDLSSQKSLSF